MMDSAAAISIGFFGVAIAAFVGLCALRHWYSERMCELGLALEELQSYVKASETLKNDPRTPEAVVNFIDMTAVVIANHRYVGPIAKHLAAGYKPAKIQSESTARFVAAARQLEETAPELSEQLKAMVFSALMAMMLRWPQTREIALKFAAKSSDAKFVEKSSATIFDAVASSPECLAA